MFLKYERLTENRYSYILYIVTYEQLALVACRRSPSKVCYEYEYVRTVDFLYRKIIINVTHCYLMKLYTAIFNVRSVE